MTAATALTLDSRTWIAGLEDRPMLLFVAGPLMAGFDPRELQRLTEDDPPYDDLRVVMSDPFGVGNGGAPRGLRLVAHLNHLKWVEAGAGLSYGHTFVAARRSRIATVTIGYGDGYNRSLSNRGAMVVRGVPCPVVGRVCMDQTLLDVTDHPDRDAIAIGDEAIVFGPVPPDPTPPRWPTWEAAATLAGVTPAALLGAIGPRVARAIR
jgi:hypothetical protein